MQKKYKYLFVYSLIFGIGRLVLGAEGEKERNYDFLNSIEVSVLVNIFPPFSPFFLYSKLILRVLKL